MQGRFGKPPAWGGHPGFTWDVPHPAQASYVSSDRSIAGAPMNPERYTTFSLAGGDADVTLAGFSPVEGTGRWTDGPRAEIAFTVPHSEMTGLMVVVSLRPFVWGAQLPRQTVAVQANGVPVATWAMTAGLERRRPLFIDRAQLGGATRITLSFDLPDARSPQELGINNDNRRLGIQVSTVGWALAAERPAEDALLWQFGRPVGPEARKTFDRYIENGFWTRFVTGPNVLDIGFRGGGVDQVVPILPGAIGVDLDYPGYDGRTLPFPDNSQDAVFVSHCLEHIPAHINAIRDWHRVVKVGGHIIVAVPHAHLYERRHRPPSHWNQDHQRCYTSSSLLGELEAALVPNTYRVRHLEENDAGYDYAQDPKAHPPGCYEIVAVLEKLARPAWDVEA